MDRVAPPKPQLGYRSPEILTATKDVRGLGVRDIPEILDVERQALPDTLSARFGRRFSDVYFRTLMSDARFFCDGYVVEGRLVGFITYTTDVSGVLSDALRRHFLAYLWALGGALIARPSRWRTLVHIARGVLRPAADGTAAPQAELLTIALLHEARGASARGTAASQTKKSVSHSLTSGACERLAALGATTVQVMCRPQEPIANKFVQNQGFVAHGEVMRFGDRANRYVKRLAPIDEPG